MLNAYTELEARFRRLSLLSESIGMLRWDMSVMMPPGGAQARTEQIATLKLLYHELMTDPAVAVDLDRAEDLESLDDWQAANLQRMRQRWLHTTAVPADLVEATTRAANATETIWRTARPQSDFKSVLPSFTELLGLVRDGAAAKAAALEVPAYDALMDLYEPGMTTTAIDGLFDDYAAFLPEFLEEVLHVQASRPIRHHQFHAMQATA